MPVSFPHHLDILFTNTCTVHTTARALTSLNLASNELYAEGAKHVAGAIKVNVSALRFDSHHFELDLTSGSTAVLLMDIPIVTPHQGGVDVS